MVDALFEHPRLVAIYDALDRDRSDLDTYVGIVDELGAHRVLDIGCGTGTFALLLAGRGVEVVGLDPAAGSLAVARAKPGADRVTWVHGDVTALPPIEVDVATMTGNVAQAIAFRADWEATLRGVHRALKPGGHLVLETRDPAYQAWQKWTRAESFRSTEIDGVGTVDSWVEVSDIDRTEVDGLLVRFRWSFTFVSDSRTLTSDSTLRFRGRDQVEADLVAQGFAVDDVRDAPDRPGREFVFLARRAP